MRGKKIIFDCDNTMGIKGCDVDDGLALLYLLGNDSASICGITTTYGNSELDLVYDNTCKMLRDLGKEQIKVYKGCPHPSVLQSEAVDFIVEAVNAEPGQISILATGSLTNLRGAYAKDPNFFDKVAGVVLMGGITEKLVINGTVLPELNFSCDPLAAALVLGQGKKVSVITGNNCLAAYFSWEEFTHRLKDCAHPVGRYIYEKCSYWFEEMMEAFGLDGFHNWDVVAAVYLMHPELFENRELLITPRADLLKEGWLLSESGDQYRSVINTPRIKDVACFKNHVYYTWLCVKTPTACQR